MKKTIAFLIISALFSLTAQTATAATGTNMGNMPGWGTMTKAKAASFDPACVVSAVNKREDALLAAIEARFNTHKSALSARKNALTAAWALTEAAARNTAVKKSWTDYNSAVTKAQSTFKGAKDLTWKTFGTERKACKAPTVPGESTTVSGDAKL